MSRENPPSEFPFVCLQCASVYRVRSDQLTSATVGCTSCGHRRETSILRGLLPRKWLRATA